MPATTQAVRLVWTMEPGSRYRPYRNLFDQGYRQPLLWLSWIAAISRTARPARRHYYYSLVMLDANGAETPSTVTEAVQVTRVISAAEALQRGLIESEGDAWLGMELELAWHPLAPTTWAGTCWRLMYGRGRRSLASQTLGICATWCDLRIRRRLSRRRHGSSYDAFCGLCVALPFLLMILFKVIFGIGPERAAFACGGMIILLWPAPARLVRGQILRFVKKAT